MLKHIVMFNVKDSAEGKNKEEILKHLKIEIENLKTKISVIQHIEAGINFSTRDTAYDLILYSEFLTEEDLQTYQDHPDHVALKNILGKYMTSLVVGDYFID